MKQGVVKVANPSPQTIELDLASFEVLKDGKTHQIPAGGSVRLKSMRYRHGRTLNCRLMPNIQLLLTEQPERAFHKSSLRAVFAFGR